MHNANKKELLFKIAEELNSHSWIDPCTNELGFNVEQGLVDRLGFLPEENLKGIIQSGFNFDYYDTLYEYWRNKGLLKLKPYITNESDVPTLVLEYNRYIHLYRSTYFQVSGDVDGVTSLTSGSYDISFIANIRPDNIISKKSVLAYMLWCAALIDVGFQFESFRRLFNENQYLLDKFLHDSIWDANISDFSYGLEDLSQYIRYSVGNIDKKYRVVHQIVSNNEVYAYLAVGTHSIQVETYDELVTITIPSIDIGTGLSLHNIKDKSLLEKELESYAKFHYTSLLARFALNLSGIRLSTFKMVRLSEKDMKPMKPLVNNIQTLYDTLSIVPDNF